MMPDLFGRRLLDALFFVLKKYVDRRRSCEFVCVDGVSGLRCRIGDTACVKRLHQNYRATCVDRCVVVWTVFTCLASASAFA